MNLVGLHISGFLPPSTIKLMRQTVGTPDTLSEAGSMKSRSRKVLPYLPPEEPAPLPAQAKKSHDRMR